MSKQAASRVWVCRRPIAAIFLLWRAVCCGLPAGLADAAEQTAPAIRIEGIDVGIAGYYKVGRATPLTVRVNVDRPCRVRCTVEVPDAHGNRTLIPGDERHLPRAGEYRLPAIFKSGRLDGSLRCGLEWFDSSGERPVWQTAVERSLRSADGFDSPLRPALEQSVVFVATLGRPAGFERLPEMSKPVRVAAFENSSRLPAEYAGYDGLDALVINGNHPLSAEQSRAIRDWVRSGGHLIVSLGRDVAAFQQGPLYEWMGEVIPLSGSRQLRGLSGLQSLAGENAPIALRRGQGIPAARLNVAPGVNAPDRPRRGQSEFAGEVLVSELRQPLVVRCPYAFGRITFFGIDLDRPPLSDWEPLPDVLRTLLFDEFRPIRESSRRRQGRLAETGISDLATQWQFSLQDFPEVHRIPTWKVMVLLLLYLSLIGPADYYLVRRLFRDPRFTWLSFPAMVVVAAALAVWTAGRANGRDWQLNQIDVIDVDADAAAGAKQFVRTSTWMTVYSPNTMRNRVTIVPQPVREPLTGADRAAATVGQAKDSSNGRFRLSWAGVPEDNFGGMYRSGGIEFGRPTYRFAADSAAIDDLPTSIWSTADLTATRIEEVDAIVRSDLTSRGYGLISGTITHHLAGPLHDWMLAYGPAAYFPAENPRTGERAALDPDTLWTTDDPNIRPRELEDYLTQTRLTRVKRRAGKGSAEYRLAQSEYDPFHRDPSDILRMITFYRRAGGKRYTRLENDSLRRFDFSFLLEMDRAVLFGRIDPPAAELRLNDRALVPTRRQTFVRIVLPVRQAD